MKSICLVVQNVYDIDPRVRRKAEALVEAGYSVDVLAIRAPHGKEKYTLGGVNVETVDLGKKRGSLGRYFFEYVVFFLWVMFKVPMLMPSRKYAIVDVNTLPDFLIFAPFAARWMGAKLVLDMHEITPEFYMSKFKALETSLVIRTMKFLEWISFKFADYVLTVNDPIEDLLVSRGLNREKSFVLMNSANEARFAGYANAQPEAKPGKFVLMYHGTLTPIYGLDIAVEGFALAHKEMPGAELWILGKGTEEGLLRKIAEERGVADKVKLVGQVSADEISKWLDQCDAGILPLRRDVFLDFCFPNKLGEFIVMGKPVIMSRLKAIEYYFSEQALAYFDPDDTADLARQMIAMYRDPAARVRKVAKAREEYAPIRWDLVKQRYIALMDSLVAPEGASAKIPAAGAAQAAGKD